MFAVLWLLAGCSSDKEAFDSATLGDDPDGDGETEYDCVPFDPEIYPGAVDTVGDGIDQNCDLADGVDYDGDDYASIESGGEDCDDRDPDTFPSRLDLVGDAVDGNCDGIDGVDFDQDGYADLPSGGDDCVDGDPEINPGATEIPGNNVDEDCDGVMD